MSQRRIEGIIFDLDATLVNLGGFVEWTKAQIEIVNNYLKHACDPKLVNEYCEKGLFNMLELMYIHLQEENTENAFEIQNKAYDILAKYESIGANSCTLMDGCKEILEWLKFRKVPLGICTSNSQDSAEIALRLQGIRNYFKVVLGRTINIPIKPHPAQLELCFNMIGIDPKKGMMVGDSHKDVIAGKKIGAYTVGIPAHFTRINLMEKAGVDVIINNLSELKYVIERF